LKVSKVLFIGLGGAGQRHLRILKNLLPEDVEFFSYRRIGKTPLLNSDFTVDKTRSIEEKFNIKMLNSLNEAFEVSPELTVISTPTSCHRESLMMAMEAGSSIIVEKPWAEDLTDFSLFSNGILNKKLPFLISFQRRYHPLILKAYHLFKSGSIGRPMVANFTVFSDVTTWHGYEDWRTLYAVRKELGGGVLLTEIHEIDLVYWFFGIPNAVHCTGGNRSSERLNVEDTVQLTLIYASFSVQITLCFINKIKMRSFYISGTEGTLSWDETFNKLVLSTFTKTPEEFFSPSFTNDSMFISQAEHFFSNWSYKNSEESLLSAGYSLAIVEAARKSMKSGNTENIPQSIIQK
jgi:predicted dehydrogenase